MKNNLKASKRDARVHLKIFINTFDINVDISNLQGSKNLEVDIDSLRENVPPSVGYIHCAIFHQAYQHLRKIAGAYEESSCYDRMLIYIYIYIYMHICKELRVYRVYKV